MNKGIAFKRVKTPTIIQMEATECGAVAIGIILAYYGRYVPIEELRLACGVSRNGSNAYSMIKGVEKYGVIAKGYSLSLNDLYSLELPVILFWKFEHFVILEGFGKDCVYINDPATGPRTISYQDLDEAFTGVAITVKTTKEFTKGGRPFSLTRALWNRAKKVKGPIIYAALVGIALIAPNLAFPALTQVFIDQILINQNMQWQKGIIAGIILSILVSMFLTILQGTVLNRLQTKLSIQLASESFWHMLRLPLSFYTQRYPGEVASRLALNESISSTIAGNLISNIINVIFAIFYGVVIFYYDVVIASVATAAIFLDLFFMQFVYRSRKDAYSRVQAEQGRNVSLSLSALEDIETIKATGMEFKFFSRWAGYFTKVLIVLQDLGKKDIFLSVMSSLLNSLTTLVLIGVGIWRILNGYLTIGMFVALQILLRNFMNPIQNLVSFTQSLQFLKVDMARLDDMKRYPEDKIYDKNNEKNQTLPPKLSGQCNIKEITFGYTNIDEPIFSGISFELSPGKSVGLIGPTGCGKSSIAKLISRLYTPWSGEILFDDTSLKKIPRLNLSNTIGFVEQETFFFKGSLLDNLTLFDPLVRQEEVIKAAMDACIHEDILSRAGGYDMEVDENGMNLSAGQKQRLEITRALIKNPTLLILDEASSALDSQTEAKILKNIKRRGCAILLITHRIGTIQDCDEILLLNKGKIESRGKHEYLKEHSPLYQELIKQEERR